MQRNAELHSQESDVSDACGWSSHTHASTCLLYKVVSVLTSKFTVVLSAHQLNQRWHMDIFSTGLQIRTKRSICWMDRVHFCSQCHLCFSLIQCSALLNLLHVDILSATKWKVYCVNTTPLTLHTFRIHATPLTAQTTNCNFHTTVKTK